MTGEGTEGWWGVVNPGAGSRTDALDRVHQVLAWRKVKAELNPTDHGSHLLELVDQGVEKGFSRFLAVGGDGTVNLVVNALLQSEWGSPPTIGVLPSGTGCDLIRTFGISQDLEEAASHLVGTETAPLDAVRLRGPWGERLFVNSAGCGLTAGVVEQVDRLPSWMGAFRYQLGIWPALIKHPHAQAEVTCGKRWFEGDALMIVLSNARFLGGGMKMAPHADPADGEVNVQVFHGPKWLALKLKPMVQRGKHLDHPN
ncbi:MAG: diacylglycerol/lipid kinase family protein, partial [Acidimicrobiia bacterium]